MTALPNRSHGLAAHAGVLRRRVVALLIAPLIAGAASACSAQQSVPDTAGPILRLDARATREVAQDNAYAVFFVQREGTDPGALQSAVNTVLETALADLKADAALQVRSGGYTTFPRYSRDGRAEGWRVRAELIADSTDPAAISRATSTLSGRMSVGSIGFRLSHAKRAEAEQALTAEAAARFYEKARAAARALGFADIELVEANYGTGTPGGPVPIARAMAAEAPSPAPPVPMQPGVSEVAVTFSGTVRLLR